VALETRSKRPEGALTTEQIVAAAMKLVAAHGIEGLTMRSLARELGVAPAAPYYYVASKDELLELVGNVIVEAIQLPDESTWQEAIRQFVLNVVSAFARFPGSDALAGSPRAWRSGARLVEFSRELLTAEGFPSDAVESARFTIRLFICGALRSIELLRHFGVAPEVASTSAEMESSIDVLIAGLEATLERSGRSST
jgi:AcrR family transcriptional regulator